MTNVAVAAIGVLSLVNLALTFAVIRQVRRYGEHLARRGTGHGQPAWHIQAGSPVPEFTAATVSGGRVSLSDLTGARSVIAFFGVGCPPCRAQLPEFTRYARSFPGGAAQVLAVVLEPVGKREEKTDAVTAIQGHGEPRASRSRADARLGTAAPSSALSGIPEEPRIGSGS